MENNAREVISIYEDKFNHQELKPIYLWDSPFIEKVSYIDNRSDIIVYINRDYLADFQDFIGSISLTAKINNRYIEVSPYSEVGKELKTVGVNGLNSTRDFASSLVSFIAEANKFNTEVFCSSMEEYYQAIEDKTNKGTEFSPELHVSLVKIQTHLSLLNNYIIYLSKSNIETTRAYSKSIKRDPIFVEHLSETFSKAIKRYSTILSEISDEGPKKSKLLDIRMRSALEDIRYVLLQLESVRDNTIYPSLAYFFSKIDTVVSLQSRDEYMSKRINETKRNTSNASCDPLKQFEFEYLYNKSNIRTIYLNEIAREASYYIYNKLEPAIIDLRKEDAKEGDVLRIYVTRYNSEGEGTVPHDTTKVDNKKEVLLAAFDIKELGFRAKVADSFLLIKRQEENLADTTISPSRFKGAPGASLMVSYGSDGGKNKFFKFWEPSLGVNVSYIDFSRSKDIEVGVAFVLGLFRNRMFFVAGRNLNIESNSTYYGLGFSFANLADAFNKNKSNE